MQEQNLFFVVPAYRLQEVGKTVEHYDEHVWRNGHPVFFAAYLKRRLRTNIANYTTLGSPPHPTGAPSVREQDQSLVGIAT
jgi:hypothetical protein